MAAVPPKAPTTLKPEIEFYVQDDAIIFKGTRFLCPRVIPFDIPSKCLKCEELAEIVSITLNDITLHLKPTEGPMKHRITFSSRK
jgi:hypothetical protein